MLRPAERLGQVRRRGNRIGAAFQPARQRRHTGLGMHPLADGQRPLGQLMQYAADGAVGLRRGVGAADLAEHLGLADHG